MPSETGNRVSDGIFLLFQKRGSLNIPTLFLPFEAGRIFIGQTGANP
ncbi:hypothetical protein [Neisseria meningitidis]|nr:hypothetical protein [Neisseria meningitidis]